MDFGASDAPLEQAELDANGLAQFPMVVGGVVLVVNLDGVADGQLKLTADLLASIYMGEIDARGTTRPSRPRTPASSCPPPRSTSCTVRTAPAPPGSSRTTSPPRPAASGRPAPTRRSPGPWASAARATRASPPACSSSAARSATSSTPTPSRRGMTTVQLQNKDGAWVKPSIDSFARPRPTPTGRPACPACTWSSSTSRATTTWPITGASFILVQKDAGRRRSRQGDARLLRLGLHRAAPPRPPQLDYVPIPENVYKLVREQVWTDRHRQRHAGLAVTPPRHATELTPGRQEP